MSGTLHDVPGGRTQLPVVAADRPRKRRFRPLRDLPAVAWLLLVVVSTLVHPWLPAPRWLMLHLLFLGAISHSILVWSEHFAVALLHAQRTDADLRRQDARLILLNLGTVTVVAGVLSTWWPVTVAGAALVVTAVGWHGAALYRRLRRALGSRFTVTVHYYVAAATLLPVGAVLGTVLARGLADPTHGQTKLSHALLNVLGWMGLTILGTLVTLWPAMLRTRMPDASVAAARRALPVLVVSLLVAAAGALLGALSFVALGLAGYLGGVVLLLAPFASAARRKPPASYATASVGLGVLWLVGALAYLLVGVVRAAAGDGGWTAVEGVFADVVPILAAGVAAPVLLGALSFLVPVSVSSGPASARAANREMDRGAWFRIAATNAALVVYALPVPSAVRVLVALLYVGAMAAFLPLMFRAMRAARRARAGTPDAGTASDDAVPPPRRAVQTLAGLVAALATVVAGLALQPAIAGTGTLAGNTTGDALAATGETETVQVEARDMRFFPDAIEVHAGTHLVIELTNADDEDVHDLVLATGASSGRLAPGESATVDVGVVSGRLVGWCSIVGHRSMGMTLAIRVADGGDQQAHAGAGHDAASHHAAPADRRDGSAAADLDPMAVPDDDFVARDAALPDLPPRPADGGPTVHRQTLEIVEKEVEVAPGVTQTLWMFDGSAPGPTLHGRVGDVFEITLVNHGSMGHSIDFHASQVAPDEPMRTIPPGESLVYRFTADRAGIWMYHCSTMPMTAHIANGMAGAVVIEPDDLPTVDRSYLLVQSELYLGQQGEPVDADRAQSGAGAADLFTFNGYANQYVARPLEARTGERVRVWVLDVGPNAPSSFHVVGAQFDRVWSEGAYRLGSARSPADGRDGGSQALGLQPAQGGFVETVFAEAGHYPFVTHALADAERGAKGVFAVTG